MVDINDLRDRDPAPLEEARAHYPRRLCDKLRDPDRQLTDAERAFLADMLEGEPVLKRGRPPADTWGRDREIALRLRWQCEARGRKRDAAVAELAQHFGVSESTVRAAEKNYRARGRNAGERLLRARVGSDDAIFADARAMYAIRPEEADAILEDWLSL